MVTNKNHTKLQNLKHISEYLQVPIVRGPTVQGPICHFFRADSWAPDNRAPGPNCPRPNLPWTTGPRDPTIRGPFVRGPTVRGPIVRGPICLEPQIWPFLACFFCKKSTSRWIQGITFFLALIFSFRCQGGLFSEASALRQN